MFSLFVQKINKKIVLLATYGVCCTKSHTYIPGSPQLLLDLIYMCVLDHEYKFLV